MVGYFNVQSYNERVAYWDEHGNRTLLGRGGAYAVNNRGQMAGYLALDEAGYLRATIWNGTTPQDLGPGVVRDINNHGQAVGDSSGQYGPGNQPTLWTGDQAIDLNTFLDASQRARWSLTGELHINDRGWIVGAARDKWNDAKTIAFVMVPVPEPATGAMMGVGIACVGLAYRRRASDHTAPT